MRLSLQYRNTARSSDGSAESCYYCSRHRTIVFQHTLSKHLQTDSIVLTGVFAVMVYKLIIQEEDDLQQSQVLQSRILQETNPLALVLVSSVLTYSTIVLLCLFAAASGKILVCGCRTATGITQNVWNAQNKRQQTLVNNETAVGTASEVDFCIGACDGLSEEV
jgi:hypothetical protein